MLAGLVSQIHRVVGEEDAERERYREKYAAEPIFQSDQHGDAARKSAMERWKSSGREDMSGIDTLISDDIYDDLRELDDASDDDHDKDRVHMEPFGNECTECVDCVLYHIQYHMLDKSIRMY